MKQRLTIELVGEGITGDKFEQGIRSFLALIKDVAQEFLSPTSITWLVDVRPGSIQVGFRPKEDTLSPIEITALYNTITHGLDSLENELNRPPFFTDSALRNVYSLATLSKPSGYGLNHVSVWHEETKKVELTVKVASHVDELIGPRYEDWGTVEGRLSMVSERKGWQFVVFDPLTDKPIHCKVDLDKFEDIIRGFRKYVAASGVIRYKSDGTPLQIEVERFEIFPDKEALPKPEEVRGILREDAN